VIRLTRSQVQPIGLDLGLDSIKMLQLEVVGDQTLSVVAAAKQPLPEEARNQTAELRLAASMDIVRQMLRTHSFHGRSIVAALPREIVHVKNLRLPMMPPAEVELAVEFEARNIFPFDTEQALVRHLPAGEVRQGSDTKLEVIAIASPEKQVSNFVEQLHRCGCVIESLDFEPNALYRGIERFIRRREDENEVHVLVDIGVQRSQVIIGRGRDISFFKPVEIGSAHLHEAVAKKLGISRDEARGLRRRLIESRESVETGSTPAAKDDPVRRAVHDATRSTTEELAREISLCLRYYSVTFRGQRPTKVRVLGGEASDPQVLAILGSVLPIPVESGKPLASVNTSKMKQIDRRGGLMSEWAVAFGLGLKLTRGYFGARDGKRRDQYDPKDAPSENAGGVEVVDLFRAVDNSTPITPVPGAPGSPPPQSSHAPKEATHA
jgi:type IV pilus assembly protein PilM